ncbi:MAG: DUF2442 domain-containing protein [Fibrobacter sp.]|nr:DUF2442 domain-containing protein [Fibrobacter sp.]
MKKYHSITDVRFEGDTLILTIDGEMVRFPVSQISSVLHNASDTERNDFEISPSGYGIHWPQLDEDLSADGLIRMCHIDAENKTTSVNEQVKTTDKKQIP